MEDMALQDKFYEAAHLDSTRMKIYAAKRQPGLRFANITIVDCQNKSWWYYNFIGIECFAELRFLNYEYGSFLSEATVIRLENSKILTGRSLDAKDFIIS